MGSGAALVALDLWAAQPYVCECVVIFMIRPDQGKLMRAVSEPAEVLLRDYKDATEAYRHRGLRQATYEESELLMAGTILHLEGEEHRVRRRMENPLFSLDSVREYERKLLPGILEETLAPHVAAGGVDLVKFGHQMLMNIAALATGIDRPKGTPEETADLFRYMMTFVEGATIFHSTRDHEVVRQEIRQALIDFDEEFLRPSAAPRRALLAQVAAGTLAESELPTDLLTILLREEEAGRLDWATLQREMAAYLLASAHTSATAFTRTAHHLFGWFAEHPEDLEKARVDLGFLQRAVSETIRLFPSSPIGLRRAFEDIELRSGTHIPNGARVVIDLMAVNRDPALFGDDAELFDPYRRPREGLPLYGLSFGMGTHACIGQRLAGGLLTEDGAGSDRVYGVVAVALQRFFREDVRRDPLDPPERDTATERPYWGRYPVIFGPSA